MKAIKNADGQVIGYIPDELPPSEFGKRVPQEGDWVQLKGWDKPYKVVKVEDAVLFIEVVGYDPIPYATADYEWTIKD